MIVSKTKLKDGIELHWDGMLIEYINSDRTQFQGSVIHQGNNGYRKVFDEIEASGDLLKRASDSGDTNLPEFIKKLLYGGNKKFG